MAPSWVLFEKSRNQLPLRAADSANVHAGGGQMRRVNYGGAWASLPSSAALFSVKASLSQGVVAVDCAAVMFGRDSGEHRSMRKLLKPCWLVVLLVACAPRQPPTTSVELTQGTSEAREALAKAVLRDLILNGSLKARVRLWVPTATNSSLESLVLSAKTSSEPSPSGGTTVKVWLECSFALDATEIDAKQTSLLDACKGEVEKALANRAREGA